MKNCSNKNILLAVSKILEGAASLRELLPLSLNLKTILITASLLSFHNNAIFAQIYDFSISVKGNYTSTSRYYPSSGVISSSSYESYQSVDNLLGYGLELRYNYSEHIKISLSGELVSDVIEYRHPTLQIPIKSDFTMYIVEADGYYYIPLSGESFKFYIGGGINLAKGSSYDELPSLKSELIASPVNIGIQAFSGMEYFFRSDFSVRWEMKFRDPIVENESKYNKSKILYNGRTYNISTKPYKSKINIDGIVFDISIAYHFF